MASDDRLPTLPQRFEQPALFCVEQLGTALLALDHDTRLC